MFNLKKIGACAIVSMLSLFGASGAASAKVDIHNLSNEAISVSVSYALGSGGDRVSSGWHVLRPNQEVSINLDMSRKPALRVIKRKGGGEITFKNHNAFLNFASFRGRFNVTATHTKNLRRLQWGANLQHSRNVYRNAALPKGWSNERYFRVYRKTHFEVTP